MAAPHFASIDYIVFGLTVCASLTIGLGLSRAGRNRTESTSEFLMAGRSMKSVPIALSLLASFLSAVTILGFPSEVYFYGVQYAIGVLAYFIAAPIVVSVFVPVFYGLKLTSAYEYLEKRFSSQVRSLASVVFLLQTLLYSAIAVYAPALALDAVTGFSVWTSIICGGLVATVYTALGGMKAVIWTDVFQAIIMLVGILSVIVLGVGRLEGFGSVFDISSKGQRLNLLNFSLDPTERLTFWSLICGHLFNYLSLWGTSQTSVQRILTANSLDAAKKSVWMMIPLTLFTITLCSLCGLVVYAVYSNERCDPISAHLVCKDDQILPFFVIDVLRGIPGLAGLFVSCIVSATLSTISSNLNSMATITLEDFIKPRLVNLSDAKATIMSKWLSLCYGILVIAMSFGFSYMQNQRLISAAASVFGATGGPLLGVFTLGMFVPKSNHKGALVGLLSGLLLMICICIGAEWYPNPHWSRLPVPSTEGCQAVQDISCSLSNGIEKAVTGSESSFIFGISFMWYSFLGFVITFVIGYLASIFSAGQSNPVDQRLLVWQRS
ncbi:sodium-coupled monocarboxylate transporter 1-like [Oscarella lobularis]|uniref:sodium-coupled monocarboxylate transporter 1-like n=1 Tax=Oscarella lobularis TaxID=121494 RepID=UPI003313EC0E